MNELLTALTLVHLIFFMGSLTVNVHQNAVFFLNTLYDVEKFTDLVARITAHIPTITVDGWVAAMRNNLGSCCSCNS